MLQKQAIEETKAVFGPLKEKIGAAVEKLEGLLVSFLFLWNCRYWMRGRLRVYVSNQKSGKLICGIEELRCIE